MKDEQFMIHIPTGETEPSADGTRLIYETFCVVGNKGAGVYLELLTERHPFWWGKPAPGACPKCAAAVDKILRTGIRRVEALAKYAKRN